MKSIQEWQRIIHNLAIEKGWYDGPPRNPLEMHALIMSEVGEATNEARKENPPVYFYCQYRKRNMDLSEVNRHQAGFSKWKPEGEAVELADVIIRILDYAQYRGWNMAEIIKWLSIASYADAVKPNLNSLNTLAMKSLSVPSVKLRVRSI